MKLIDTEATLKLLPNNGKSSHAFSWKSYLWTMSAHTESTANNDNQASLIRASDGPYRIFLHQSTLLYNRTVWPHVKQSCNCLTEPGAQLGHCTWTSVAKLTIWDSTTMPPMIYVLITKKCWYYSCRGGTLNYFEYPQGKYHLLTVLCLLIYLLYLKNENSIECRTFIPTPVIRHSYIPYLL